MYDASKYADSQPSDNSAAVTVRRETAVGPAARQLATSSYHLWSRARPLPTSSSTPNGSLIVDAQPSWSSAVHNGSNGGSCPPGSQLRDINGLSSSSDSSSQPTAPHYAGPHLNVPSAVLTTSLDDGILLSPDSVASTLSSPADVRPSSDLLPRTTTNAASAATGRCRRVTSLVDEYFPVTLGGGGGTGRRSTEDIGELTGATSTSGNGRHHRRRRHSHHRRHRQQHEGHGQGHAQGHGRRPSSGHSSSSSNSLCSYPATTASNGTVVNGTLPRVVFLAAVAEYPDLRHFSVNVK